jgi:hypothetical protein
LDSNDRILQSTTNTEAKEDLISDHMRVGRLRADSEEKAGADGSDGWAADEEVPISVVFLKEGLVQRAEAGVGETNVDDSSAESSAWVQRVSNDLMRGKERKRTH